MSISCQSSPREPARILLIGTCLQRDMSGTALLLQIIYFGNMHTAACFVLASVIEPWHEIKPFMPHERTRQMQVSLCILADESASFLRYFKNV